LISVSQTATPQEIKKLYEDKLPLYATYCLWDGASVEKVMYLGKPLKGHKLWPPEQPEQRHEDAQ
jgi:hypothetical protein